MVKTTNLQQNNKKHKKQTKLNKINEIESNVFFIGVFYLTKLDMVISSIAQWGLIMLPDC